ncbi:MAG: nicotinate-nucleotide--dimethylbenzimidazole phosphoribosyltransferase [Actinomycetota bacterium]|nr:nicotinate-nucleotide--dimethylbenzimidazole phosphoribosyltransferase [Actinomycetota bacterium]
MTELSALAGDVESPDDAAGEAVRDRLAADARLGRLAGLAEWAACVLPASSDGRFARIRGLVFGGAAERLPVEVAEQVGARLGGVDELPASAAAAVAEGARLADTEVDGGADLLILALPRLGTDAAIAVCVLTNTEPVKVLTRGAAAADPEAWMRRAVEVRDARRHCMPLRDEPDALLGAIGSAHLAAAAGFVLRAAARRTPVLLDGPASAAAALVAYEAAPWAVRWWCASDRGPDPLHEFALTRLGLCSVLDLGTGRGDGLAAMLAVPVLQAAVRLAG